MGKLKFRLSYKLGTKLIPIELYKINLLNGLDVTDIKTIDDFTMKFDNETHLLNFLRSCGLVPEYIGGLFVTVDEKFGETINQRFYAYNKKLFYNNSINKLNYSFVSAILTNKIDYDYIIDIIEHYKKVDSHKDFSTLESLVNVMKNSGFVSFDTKKEYYKELERFLKAILCKRDKTINYKNVRDLYCYMSGERPIKTKKSYEITTERKNNTEFNDETSTVTRKEYYKFIKESIGVPEKFEGYQDGNDFIAPITKKEIEVSLNDYVRKLTYKRDNGEYE